MLKGERVVLRSFRPEDLAPLWQARLDPLTWAQTSEEPLVPQTLAEHRARYDAPASGTAAQFAVDVEGRLHEATWVEGAYDDVVMTVLRSEWSGA